MKKRQGSDHPKEGIRFLPFIGQTEKAEKTAVYTTQSPEVPKGTFRDCKQSPRSRASPDFGSSPIQKINLPAMCKDTYAPLYTVGRFFLRKNVHDRVNSLRYKSMISFFSASRSENALALPAETPMANA